MSRPRRAVRRRARCGRSPEHGPAGRSRREGRSARRRTDMLRGGQQGGACRSTAPRPRRAFRPARAPPGRAAGRGTGAVPGGCATHGTAPRPPRRAPLPRPRAGTRRGAWRPAAAPRRATVTRGRDTAILVQEDEPAAGDRDRHGQRGGEPVPHPRRSERFLPILRAGLLAAGLALERLGQLDARGARPQAIEIVEARAPGPGRRARPRRRSRSAPTARARAPRRRVVRRRASERWSRTPSAIACTCVSERPLQMTK